MNFVALRMLTGDRAKYFGLVFAIAFCTFLLENQTSIFANIMKRTGNQILVFRMTNRPPTAQSWQASVTIRRRFALTTSPWWTMPCPCITTKTTTRN